VGQFFEFSACERKQDVTIKAMVTKDGLLIPREMAERALGPSAEVEISEEPGRLIVAAVGHHGAPVTFGPPQEQDPILKLGKQPVRTAAREGSTDHDRYLYEDE